MKLPPHPLQPVYIDKHGVTRFRGNAIIQWLFDSEKLSLNEIAALPFEPEDREQLAQLLGYSLAGFSELSYVTDKTYERADRARRKIK